MKTCSICNQIKDDKEFHFKRGKPANGCRQCVSARKKLIRSGNVKPSWAQIRELSKDTVVQQMVKHEHSAWVSSTPYIMCVYCGKKFHDFKWRDKHLDIEHAEMAF